MVKKGLLTPELMAVAERPANDAPQYVTSALIAGYNAIGNQKGRRTNVIGDDSQRGQLRFVFCVGPGNPGRGGDERLKKVDFIIAVHALQYRSNALKAHPRVHARARQGGHGAVGAALKLHKDEIPDLDVTIAILFRSPRGAAPNLWPVVIENLGTGAAGARIPHGPEIILVAHAGNAVGGNTDVVAPKLLGLVIAVMDRHPELFRRQTKTLREEGPGEADGITLEVIAKGEVPQHFKEGVMASGVAHVLEIVVLTPSADAALTGYGSVIGPLLSTREDILELDHPRVGKEQGGIVSWHQGTAGHDLMTVFPEELEEGAANIRAFHGDSSAWGSAGQRAKRCDGQPRSIRHGWASRERRTLWPNARPSARADHRAGGE